MAVRAWCICRARFSCRADDFPPTLPCYTPHHTQVLDTRSLCLTDYSLLDVVLLLDLVDANSVNISKRMNDEIAQYDLVNVTSASWRNE